MILLNHLTFFFFFLKILFRLFTHYLQENSWCNSRRDFLIHVLSIDSILAWSRVWIENWELSLSFIHLSIHKGTQTFAADSFYSTIVGSFQPHEEGHFLHLEVGDELGLKKRTEGHFNLPVAISTLYHTPSWSITLLFHNVFDLHSLANQDKTKSPWSIDRYSWCPLLFLYSTVQCVTHSEANGQWWVFWNSVYGHRQKDLTFRRCTIYVFSPTEYLGLCCSPVGEVLVQGNYQSVCGAPCLWSKSCAVCC